MDLQDLYELAEREIRTGLYDRQLMKRARDETSGVQAAADEVYWRLRSEAIRVEAKRFPGQSEDVYVRELRARIDREVRARRLRAGITGWMWVAVCFASLVGAAACFWMARAAFSSGRDSLYSYGVGGIICLVVGIVAYTICKRDAGQDPF